MCFQSAFCKKTKAVVDGEKGQMCRRTCRRNGGRPLMTGKHTPTCHSGQNDDGHRSFFDVEIIKTVTTVFVLRVCDEDKSHAG